MATYVVLVAEPDRPGDRGLQGHDRACRSRGRNSQARWVELKQIYWTQGPYDLIAIIEAPGMT